MKTKLAKLGSSPQVRTNKNDWNHHHHYLHSTKLAIAIARNSSDFWWYLPREKWGNCSLLLLMEEILHQLSSDNILYYARFLYIYIYTFQVVQDFFHQQYIGLRGCSSGGWCCTETLSNCKDSIAERCEDFFINFLVDVDFLTKQKKTTKRQYDQRQQSAYDIPWNPDWFTAILIVVCEILI